MTKRRAPRATGRFTRKRDAIIAASTDLINREGVKGLTLAKAAAAVGLSTTSVTYYFRRKDDLAAACLRRGIDELQEIVGHALEAPTPRERLHRLLDLYLDRARQAIRGEAAPMPLLNDIRALSEEPRREVADAFMRVFRAVRGLFDSEEMAWLGRGRRTARTHMLLEQLFWTSAWLSTYPAEDYEAVRERMYDILVGGLAADSDIWAPSPLPQLTRRRSDRQEMSRDTFLTAATKLINTRGYKGASVDKISAELNVTKGSFYHHNDAKDDLVVACFERTFEVMRQAQIQAAALPGDAWARLSSAAAALVEYQLSDQGPLLRTSALSAVPPSIRHDLVDKSNKVSEVFAQMIAEGIEEGTIRAVDPAVAAQMMMATLNAAAELPYWVRGVTQKQSASVFVRPLLMGIFVR
jgi:AcrR family transcriptional regulator